MPAWAIVIISIVGTLVFVVYSAFLYLLGIHHGSRNDVTEKGKRNDGD